MKKLRYLTSALIAGASVLALSSAARADQFNIPSGDLATALGAYMAQTGVELVIADNAFKGRRTAGVRGNLTADVALSRILAGTGFVTYREGNAIAVVPEAVRSRSQTIARAAQSTPVRVAAATAAGIESVVVTSSKIKGDIQTVPIAITALSQEQLTSRQIAGGPDLVKEVPNLTFSKTNFTGYNIQIRGIGTQAISVTTDPAVAVAFNDTPFIRNHFFEQEFYDVSQVEVLRGPQGTLYGRNATAGVVNVISAKPTDQFEAMVSADVGNYHNRRFEGMINIPVVDDRFDIRAAAEWTKRDGYSVNQLDGQPIDGRDLWSSRVTFGFKPFAGLQSYLVWEHFQENDDRLRSSKQLCEKDPIPTSINGTPIPGVVPGSGSAINNPAAYLSQGCVMTGLYSPTAFQVPNGYSLPYILALADARQINSFVDPYASTTQSRNLRVIESTVTPIYRAKNDVAELNADYNLTPDLTLTSQTGYGNDFLYSVEDYNRFNTSPGIFNGAPDDGTNAVRPGAVSADGTFCDPQIGCKNRMTGEDLSQEHAWQLSQEFRMSSSFHGPLNFSFGGNYLHYETEEDYYVFINALTMVGMIPIGQNGRHLLGPWIPNVSDNHECLNGLQQPDPTAPVQSTLPCSYIDPNPLNRINGQGHNYFRSYNPYVLNSYAGFGEAYYDLSSELKLTGGLRWTDDEKHFIRVPSEVLIVGAGYPPLGVVDQKWNEWTGRFAANWTPKLDFTDQTLVYGSFAHGYKAGGANPPGALLGNSRAGGGVANPIHPLTFKPEFIDAYEIGSKNTLLDGSLTLNGTAFFYNYKAYQISELVDRTAINLNFDATVKGAELEATFEPAPGLKFNFAGGYESTRVANGSKSVDLMDRTDRANHPGWVVVKPFPTEASNCIVPAYVALVAVEEGVDQTPRTALLCGWSYGLGVDPITGAPYVPNPTVDHSGGLLTGPAAGYPGFDPISPDATNNGRGPVPNNGQGFDKDLSGHQLPNAPHFTVSLSGEYTMPVSEDWAATLHSDFYWQSQSFARVFNDVPYDKIRGYSNVNLALILTSANGWQVLGYLKNVFDKTAITGDFLNTDDSGLTTNVFLTDPRLFGVRVTKNF
ncbi:MAG TPA: TonB-dependent receptor [Rhizomicrobium sp.]|nr:TonB-dependent receptor [Rhizomicrobium sp.]